jgi:hypothetical protein
VRSMTKHRLITMLPLKILVPFILLIYLNIVNYKIISEKNQNFNEYAPLTDEVNEYFIKIMVPALPIY